MRLECILAFVYLTTSCRCKHEEEARLVGYIPVYEVGSSSPGSATRLEYRLPFLHARGFQFKENDGTVPSYKKLLVKTRRRHDHVNIDACLAALEAVKPSEPVKYHRPIQKPFTETPMIRPDLTTDPVTSPQPQTPSSQPPSPSPLLQPPLLQPLKQFKDSVHTYDKEVGLPFSSRGAVREEFNPSEPKSSLHRFDSTESFKALPEYNDRSHSSRLAHSEEDSRDPREDEVATKGLVFQNSGNGRSVYYEYSPQTPAVRSTDSRYTGRGRH